MRILYGANSQGQGHLSKAAVLVPLLEARGHTVRVITSGPPLPPGYQFSWHRHFHGLAYRIRDDRTDYAGTVRQWLWDLPEFWRSLDSVRRIVQRFQPELILSDFEPLTASPLIQPACEVVAVSRQAALCDRAIPWPDDRSLGLRLTRSAIRLFTCGADRLFGYHYEPLSYRCLPPVLRSELARQTPVFGDHVLVYCHSDDGAGLVAWAASRRQVVRAYGFASMPRGRQGWVDFRAPSRTGLLEDLRTCRAVMTSAGLTTPIEAFLLGKPCCVVPIASQWEQLVNAFHLQESRLAEIAAAGDYDRLLETPPPIVHHPLRPWLATPADAVVDVLLDDRRAIDARWPAASPVVPEGRSSQVAMARTTAVSVQSAAARTEQRSAALSESRPLARESAAAA